MNPLPISVTVISGAEASRIGRALESVAGWADEIIVVLNEEVRDGTDLVVAKFGAKVIREQWKGFIGQKNSAADKASQPWILNLDADEAVSQELRAEIARAVAAGGTAHSAYEFARCSCYFGRWIRHGDWYPDRVRRLWRRGHARWTGDDPHATLQVDGTVGRLRGNLLHYPTDSFNQQVAKTVHYADDFARLSLERGRRITALDLAVRPGWRFARAYFLKLGFLDGWQGYSIACMAAFYTFLRYARAHEAQMNRSQQP